MTAKEYLSKAYWLNQRIDKKLAQVSRLKNMATKATGSHQAQRLSGTSRHSPMENCLVEVIDLEYEINADIDRLVDLKHELAACIMKLEDCSQKQVLELRYLDGLTWEDIAKLMRDYDVQRIFQVHGKALQQIEKVLRNEKQQKCLLGGNHEHG